MVDFIKILEDHKGPPVNIKGIARSLGIEVDKKANLDSDISGQIEQLENGRYRISANMVDHYYRQRFTIAHELGHFLCHSHLISDGIDDNRAYRSTPEGRFYNRSIGPKQETEANRFAAAVLMPGDNVREEWQRLNDLEAISKRFQVSKKAMRIRLESLKILEDLEHIGA